MYGRIDELVDEFMVGGWMYGRMDELVYKLMVGWLNGRTNG